MLTSRVQRAPVLRDGVHGEDVVVLALVGLPVVAAMCLGLLLQSIESGSRLWPLWALLLVCSVVLWVFLWRLTP